MKVTVILTTYNHEKYIEQALDSVLMQEATFGFEIVVLEDCSTDRTRDILLAYQKREPGKIRLVLAERNQCSNTPFVTAFQAARGQYIAALDGDDYWTSSRKLQKQVDFLDAHPECAMCFHNVTVFYEDESREPWNRNPSDQKEISTLEDLWVDCFIAGCSPMFRQGVLGDLPDWYHSEIVADYPLYILHAERGKIGYINEVMGAYRVHSGGLWSGLSEIEKFESLILLYDGLNAHLDFKYQKPIGAAISKWRADLATARATAVESEAQLKWQRPGIDYGHLNSRILRIVRATLPPHATAIVLSHRDRKLLQMEGRRALHIHESEWPEQLFAQGAQGSQDAPWISAGATFEFRLYAGTEREALLASVAVRRSDQAESSGPLSPAPPDAAPYIVAAPNPVPAGAGQGTTTITWRTGGDSSGQVYLFLDRGVSFPADSAAAQAQLEVLRAKGADFLFLSYKTLWWLDHYAEFKRRMELQYGVLAHQDDACIIFDLRMPARESDPESAPVDGVSITPEAPLVSVIIPCHNEARFLSEAIESVLVQSHRNFEIIVVDDGSTDRPQDIVASYSGARCITQANQGLATARNVGMRASRGGYLVFLDADDRLLPEALTVGLEELNANPECAFVYGDCTFISSSGYPLFPPGARRIQEEHFVHLLEQCHIWTPGTAMFRRTVFESLAEFDASVSPTADYDLYLRVARQFPIHGHEQVVLEYRQHGANMSSNLDVMLESVLRTLYAQLEDVKGDKKCEGACRRGIKWYKIYYGDPFVREARTRSARRIREIDSLLASPISPQQRDALVQEWKDLYHWMSQVVRIAESSGAQRASEVPEEGQCLLEIAREKNAAEREASRLRSIVKRQAEELGVLSAALAKRLE